VNRSSRVNVIAFALLLCCNVFATYSNQQKILLPEPTQSTKIKDSNELATKNLFASIHIKWTETDLYCCKVLTACYPEQTHKVWLSNFPYQNIEAEKFIQEALEEINPALVQPAEITACVAHMRDKYSQLSKQLVGLANVFDGLKKHLPVNQ
jgi:hypothetical protein